jgi:hypothetical protein
MTDENEDPSELRLEKDSRVVDEWTRVTLFPKVKFLYADSDLRIGGPLYNFFSTSCVGNGTGLEQRSDEGGDSSPRSEYRKVLWTRCIPRIRKNLSVKRSGVTNQMGCKFIGE